MNNNLNERIANILKDVFPNSEPPLNIENLKIGDLPDWDSLGNFNLLLAIEEEFTIRFGIDDFAELKSIEQIKKSIDTE